MVAVIIFKGRQRNAGKGSKMDFTVATVVIKCRVSFKERNPKEKFQSLKRRKALKMSTNKFMSFHLFRWRLEHLVLNNKDIKVCV